MALSLSIAKKASSLKLLAFSHTTSCPNFEGPHILQNSHSCAHIKKWNRLTVASLVILVVLLKYPDALYIHFRYDFFGSTKTGNVLIIILKDIAVKLVIQFVPCCFYRKNNLYHLSKKFQGKASFPIALGMIRDGVLVQINNHDDQLPSYRIHLCVHSISV